MSPVIVKVSVDVDERKVVFFQGDQIFGRHSWLPCCENMASSNTDYNELIRRHVQQNVNNTHQDVTYNVDHTDEKIAVKQSPYCFQNFLCLGVAIAVFYFTDFLNILLYDVNIKSNWFWSGVVFLSVHVGIAVYIIFYQSFWKKLHADDWEKKFPKIFPIATASFIIGIICLTVSLWPVWGFLTPFILIALFLGGVVIIAMIVI
ncbi:hypothetical protein Btru_026166 [Bulinus truncatus]|nr:hypothetical protein Btru_026166 [Bulinus truncatus]